ncbi:MAG: NTPase [candidate division KSB1 bacterium]|nr:NTPase [candidate division KSB1 bacterium]
MINILLTGKPGVGKTTLIQRILRISKLKPGGFYTQEIRERNARVGFEIITLSGQRGILSHINVKSPYRVGKYRVHLEDLDRVAVVEIWRALREEELVVIDEIGKMELFSEKFKQAVLAALNSEKPVLGTIMLGSTAFVDTIKRPGRRYRSKIGNLIVLSFK